MKKPPSGAISSGNRGETAPSREWCEGGGAVLRERCRRVDDPTNRWVDDSVLTEGSSAEAWKFNEGEDATVLVSQISEEGGFNGLWRMGWGISYHPWTYD
ncbi:hypothetical protein L1987_02306 [Smallanthus sonchifolius]|uniref:Uncharacterized protein n=1 Tax=Smallanthus sonchifolius TaxID=185202 RepID=A0ACB9K7F8_9ASTR|nr:hypothetical protein L1987_02306 [Smallanthus sonchifolius]